jgi:chemotaxis protein histidine kinase CheA
MLGGTIEMHSTTGHGTHVLFQIPTVNAVVFA